MQGHDYFRNNNTVEMACNCSNNTIVKKVSIEKYAKDNLVKLVKDGVISKDQLVKMIKIK